MENCIQNICSILMQKSGNCKFKLGRNGILDLNMLFGNILQCNYPEILTSSVTEAAQTKINESPTMSQRLADLVAEAIQQFK